MSEAPAPLPLDHTSQSRKKVPKQIHYIWIGGTIPTKYIKGIKKSVDVCPNFQVNLWISEKMSFGDEDHANNTLAAEEAGATVQEIDDLVSSKFTPTEKWAMELEWGWKDGRDGAKKPNFGAVSDIIRAIILMDKGGIYIDTDCGAKAALNDFDCLIPFGFQAATGNDLNPDSTMPSNCVMISIKGGRYIGCYRQWVNDKYGSVWNQGLKKSALKKIFRGPDGVYVDKHVEEKTLFMTGPSALAGCALGKLTVNGNDVGQKLFLGGCVLDMKDFKVDKKGFKIAYDNSWLDKKVVEEKPKKIKKKSVSNANKGLKKKSVERL